MLDAHHFPEDAVNVPGEINDAALSQIPEINLRFVGLRNSRVNLFHRQIRIGRNQGEGRSGKVPRRVYLQPPNAVDDARGIVQPIENWMRAASFCVSLEPK